MLSQQDAVRQNPSGVFGPTYLQPGSNSSPSVADFSIAWALDQAAAVLAYDTNDKSQSSTRLETPDVQRAGPMSVNDAPPSLPSSGQQLAWDILFALTDHEFPSPEGALPSSSATHDVSGIQHGHELQGYSGKPTSSATGMQAGVAGNSSRIHGLGSQVSCPAGIYSVSTAHDDRQINISHDASARRSDFPPTSAPNTYRRALSLPLFRRLPSERMTAAAAGAPQEPPATSASLPAPALQPAVTTGLSAAIGTGRRTSRLTDRALSFESLVAGAGGDDHSAGDREAGVYGLQVVSTNESSPEAMKLLSEGTVRKSPSSVRDRAGPSKRRCVADGCKADISQLKEYYRRRKLCEECINSREIQYGGCSMRFCQQCSKLHNMTEFDGPKRSCRKRLEKHRLAVSRKISLQSSGASASPARASGSKKHVSPK